MPTPEHGDARRIVAGVDGSASSISALRWAIRQAGLTGTSVAAVIAWHYPAAAAGGGYGMAVAGLEASDYRQIAEKIIADAIGSTLDPASGVRVRPSVVEGHSARVLLDASAGADLLVVGSRGHGGFTEALLGSVSQHCVQHASCPVVVIRSQDSPTQP
jgi:nucleotide-binding universal stress UspA family protein